MARHPGPRRKCPLRCLTWVYTLNRSQSAGPLNLLWYPWFSNAPVTRYQAIKLDEVLGLLALMCQVLIYIWETNHVPICAQFLQSGASIERGEHQVMCCISPLGGAVKSALKRLASHTLWHMCWIHLHWRRTVPQACTPACTLLINFPSQLLSPCSFAPFPRS